MRRNLIKIASSVAVGLGLFSLYLVFLGRFSTVADFSNLSEVEAVILITQVLRALVLLGVSSRFQVQPIVPIIVFSFEALLIPPLLVLIILTGDPFYATFMGVLLTAWFGATALILTPYTIYGFTKSMVRDNSLSGVIVVSTLELTSVLFLSNLLNGTNSVSGLTGLGTLIITLIKSEVASVGIPNPSGDAVSEIGLALFFLGMIIYATLGYSRRHSTIKIPWILLVPLAGTVLTLIWAAVVVQYQTDILVVLTAPAAFLFLMIWGTAREK
ncbi:MAG: hypothetical protein OK457_10180 [Thaumarchaeota archaeon]|nr:hypothetical protein [Nitrososphaerota archaeon]